MNLVVRISIPLLVCIVVLTAIFLPASAETIIITAITTFVSVCGAYFVIELIKEQEEIEKKINYINSATSISLDILSSLVQIKKESVMPREAEYRKLIESHRCGNRIDIKNLLTGLANTTFPIEFLDEIFFSHLAQSRRNLWFYSQLRKNIHLFTHITSLSNDLINEYKDKKYTYDQLVKIILSISDNNQNRDYRYKNYLDSLSENVDFNLRLTYELLEELFNYGKILNRKVHLKNLKISRVELIEDLESVIPPREQYEDFFRTIDGLNDD